MPDEVKRIRRGGRAIITIGDAEPTGEAEGDKSAARRRSAIMSGVLEDDEVLRRGKPVLMLFDLGTRLRSVDDLAPGIKDFSRARALDATEVPEYHEAGDWLNEYVELAIDGAASVTDGIDPFNNANSGLDGFQIGLSDDLQKALDKCALGARWRAAGHADAPPADPLDPFGTSKANFSGRKIFNCAPLAFELFGSRKGSIAVDVILKRDDRTEILPASEVPRPRVRLIGRPYNGGQPIPDLPVDRWKKRKPAEKDSLEKWNLLNLGSTSGNAGNEPLEYGYFDTKGLGAGFQVEVDSRLYYERFDTSDHENFKVTRTPYFEGDEVEFSLDAGSECRIYLKPVWLAGTPNRRYLAGYQITFKTYYWNFGYLPDGHTPKVSIGHTVINKAGNLNIGLLNVFAPGQTAITSDITADLAAPVVTVSGGGGGFTFNAEPHGAGLWDVLGQAFTSPGLAPAVDGFGVPDGAHGSATIVPGWQPNSAILQFFTMVFYPVAFRLPIYAKIQNSGWNTVFDYMGGNGFHHAEALANGYQNMTGIQLGFNNGFDPQGAFAGFVTRHPGLNLQEFGYYMPDKWAVRPISYYAQDAAAGRECSISGALLRAPGFVPHPPLDETLFKNEMTRLALSLKGCLGGMAWIQDVDSDFYTPAGFNHYQPPSGFNNNIIDAVLPMNQPEGLLCGVIIQDNREFYVWRRVARNNRLADYNRENFTGFY